MNYETHVKQSMRIFMMSLNLYNYISNAMQVLKLLLRL